MTTGTTTPDIIVATLEELKKAQENQLKSVETLKQIMLMLKELEEE